MLFKYLGFTCIRWFSEPLGIHLSSSSISYRAYYLNRRKYYFHLGPCFYVSYTWSEPRKLFMVTIRKNAHQRNRRSRLKTTPAVMAPQTSTSWSAALNAAAAAAAWKGRSALARHPKNKKLVAFGTRREKNPSVWIKKAKKREKNKKGWYFYDCIGGAGFNRARFVVLFARTRASGKMKRARTWASGLYGARWEGGRTDWLRARGGGAKALGCHQSEACAKSVCAEQLPEAVGRQQLLLFDSGRAEVFSELLKKKFFVRFRKKRETVKRFFRCRRPTLPWPRFSSSSSSTPFSTFS